jgi:hypothetical protein
MLCCFHSISLIYFVMHSQSHANNVQLFVGVWDRDVPVTGAGLMRRHAGSSAPGGLECMTCGAVHPPVHQNKLQHLPDNDLTTVVSASAAVAAQCLPASKQLAPSIAPPCSQPCATDAIIAMLRPPYWLPTEISLLQLGSGWLGHGGSLERPPPPPANISQPLRTTCRAPPACQLDGPLSWSPLEDERLAMEAATAAGIKAADDAEAAKRSADAERRAAAKQRLQLAGAKVVKGLGKDDEPLTPEHQRQHADRDGKADAAERDEVARAVVHPSQAHSAEADQAFADAGGALSAAEVGSFHLEGGWCVLSRFLFVIVFPTLALVQVLRQRRQRHAPWSRDHAV